MLGENAIFLSLGVTDIRCDSSLGYSSIDFSLELTVDLWGSRRSQASKHVLPVAVQSALEIL